MTNYFLNGDDYFYCEVLIRLINDALDDFEIMALQQFTTCSDMLATQEDA